MSDPLGELREKLRKVILTPFDVCACGDYRRDHEEGTGKCQLPDTMVHGFKPCLQFRLAGAATEIPEFFRDHPEYLRANRKEDP